jgi:hypothetical protein
VKNCQLGHNLAVVYQIEIMAISKCAHCESTQFAMVGNKPRGSDFELMFIQCAGCHKVVGVTDRYNIGYLLKQLAQALKVKL